MEPFLESLVLSDVMKLPIVGMPNSETRVLRICFRMHNGSQTLDMLTAASFVTTFIDTVGSTFKLSREVSHLPYIVTFSSDPYAFEFS